MVKKQNVFTLHRDAHKYFSRRKTALSGLNFQWALGLTSVQHIAKWNDDILYLLGSVDVFSKHFHVQPLKGRKIKEVVKTFYLTLPEGTVLNIAYSDKGPEFINAVFKNCLKKTKIANFVPKTRTYDRPVWKE